MAKTTPRPYSQFNFLVDFGTAHGPHGGFQEFSHIDKFTGLNKATDVIMKRGVISSSTLQDWLDDIRKKHKRAKRKVKVSLQDESNHVVQTWTFVGSRIVKYTGPPLNAKGNDVAIEELVLSYERIELNSDEDKDER
jgi:phage tail-like protein